TSADGHAPLEQCNFPTCAAERRAERAVQRGARAHVEGRGRTPYYRYAEPGPRGRQVAVTANGRCGDRAVTRRPQTLLRRLRVVQHGAAAQERAGFSRREM